MEACLVTLPSEAIACVCQQLDVKEIGTLACTCRSLRKICSDDSLWRTKCAQAFSHLPMQPQSWICTDSAKQRAHRQGLWPAATYRSLWLAVSPMAELTGIWESVRLSAESHITGGKCSRGTRCSRVLAFVWLPGALACLDLQLHDSVSGGHHPVWRVQCLLGALSAHLPRVERLHKGALMLHPEAEATSSASGDAQARAETAMGRHSLRTGSFGSSPPGSFESEVLAFMSATGPQRRAQRRSSMRAGKRPQVAEWTQPCHLRQLHTTSGVSAAQARHLRGLWLGTALSAAGVVTNTPDSMHVVEIGYCASKHTAACRANVLLGARGTPGHAQCAFAFEVSQKRTPHGEASADAAAGVDLAHFTEAVWGCPPARLWQGHMRAHRRFAAHPAAASGPYATLQEALDATQQVAERRASRHSGTPPRSSSAGVVALPPAIAHEGSQPDPLADATLDLSPEVTPQASMADAALASPAPAYAGAAEDSQGGTADDGAPCAPVHTWQEVLASVRAVHTSGNERPFSGPDHDDLEYTVYELATGADSDEIDAILVVGARVAHGEASYLPSRAALYTRLVAPAV